MIFCPFLLPILQHDILLLDKNSPQRIQKNKKNKTVVSITKNSPRHKPPFPWKTHTPTCGNAAPSSGEKWPWDQNNSSQTHIKGAHNLSLKASETSDPVSSFRPNTLIYWRVFHHQTLSSSFPPPIPLPLFFLYIIKHFFLHSPSRCFIWLTDSLKYRGSLVFYTHFRF